MATGARIVDLSGDFRLRDAAAYKRYYGADHPCPERAHRRDVRLRPAGAEPRGDQEGEVRRLAGLLRDDDRARRSCRSRRRGCSTGAVETVGITGSSGSGVAPERGDAPPGRARTTSGRTSRSTTSTSPRSRRRSPTPGAKDVDAPVRPGERAALARHLRDSFAHVTETVDRRADRGSSTPRRTRSEPFVRVPGEAAARGRRRSTGRTTPRSACRSGDATDGKRVVACFSATDNLIKGGAGQAIQSMNLMLGLDERLTLEDPGGWP